MLSRIFSQRKIMAIWNFEHKLSISETEIGCLSHPEISEYSLMYYVW